MKITHKEATIVGILLIGLVSGLLLSKVVSPSVTYTTSSYFLVPACSSYYLSNGYCESNGYPSSTLVQAALKNSNSNSMKFNISAYDFSPSSHLQGANNNTLQICLANIESEPVLVSTRDILVNDSTIQQQSIHLISSYTFVDNTGAEWALVGEYKAPVTQAGQVYVDPTMYLTIVVVFPHVSLGANTTLTVFDNTWSFRYGTFTLNPGEC